MKTFAIYFKADKQVRIIKGAAGAAKALGIAVNTLESKCKACNAWENERVSVMWSATIELSRQGGKRKNSLFT